MEIPLQGSLCTVPDIHDIFSNVAEEGIGRVSESEGKSLL